MVENMCSSTCCHPMKLVDAIRGVLCEARAARDARHERGHEREERTAREAGLARGARSRGA
jgi:hypothetical protein